MIDKNTKICSVPFAPITLFDFLSLTTDPSHHRWDKMSKKTKLPLKNTVRYALEQRESEILTSPLTTLTTSYGTPGTGSWIPKMRAKDRAIEGHIYISTARPMFRESRGRQRSYWLLKNEWCLFEKRRLLHVDPDALKLGHGRSQSLVSSSDSGDRNSN